MLVFEFFLGAAFGIAAYWGWLRAMRDMKKDLFARERELLNEEIIRLRTQVAWHINREDDPTARMHG